MGGLPPRRFEKSAVAAGIIDYTGLYAGYCRDTRFMVEMVGFEAVWGGGASGIIKHGYCRDIHFAGLYRRILQSQRLCATATRKKGAALQG